MKLYIIRHGETQWNKLGLLQGQTDISLNENGKKLAVETGGSLREVPFSGVISSPLGRALETARLVTGDRNISIVTDERIQEISFGSLEGRPVKNSGDPETTRKMQQFFLHPEQYEAPEGGESIEQLLERTGDFLTWLAGNPDYHAEDTLLISTHGAASRALLANIQKKTSISDFWGSKVPGNCSVSIAELKSDEWEILEMDKIYYKEKTGKET
ncbi:MAG: histidine phosphatase family protein [Lachnospiraceae bacterium]|nr:histidine phosphatase family protein [Lachnospiraceae bacterium]